MRKSGLPTVCCCCCGCCCVAIKAITRIFPVVVSVNLLTKGLSPFFLVSHILLGKG